MGNSGWNGGAVLTVLVGELWLVYWVDLHITACDDRGEQAGVFSLALPIKLLDEIRAVIGGLTASHVPSTDQKYTITKFVSTVSTESRAFLSWNIILQMKASLFSVCWLITFFSFVLLMAAHKSDVEDRLCPWYCQLTLGRWLSSRLILWLASQTARVLYFRCSCSLLSGGPACSPM